MSTREGEACAPPFRKLALAWLLFALLALAACGRDQSAFVGDETPSAAPPIQYPMAEAKTVMPAEASPTVPKPTATFVPLITPSPTATGDTPTRADVPRITVQAAQLQVEAGEAILVDVRTRATYEVNHIAGAISMPFDEVSRRSAELPTNKLVIFYCA